MNVDEIKQRYTMRDVLEICGIKYNGRGNISCIKNHKDKNPSMQIFSDGFKCHSCGFYGDIFAFYQEYNHCDFKTAYLSLGGTYEHEESEFAERMRIAKIEKQKADREKQRKFESDFKSELLALWKFYKDKTKELEPFSDKWCLAQNELPYIIGVWEEKFINERAVSEIDVLRRCRKVKQRFDS